MANLTQLPIEVTLIVGKYLPSLKDISALSRVNLRFRAMLFKHLLDLKHKKLTSGPILKSKGPDFLVPGSPAHGLLPLFYAAASADSANMMQWLTSYTDELDFKG